MMPKIPAAALNHHFAFLGQVWRKVEDKGIKYDRYKTNRMIIQDIEKTSMEQRLINAHAARVEKAGNDAKIGEVLPSIDDNSSNGDSVRSKAVYSERDIEQLSTSIKAISEKNSAGSGSKNNAGRGALTSYESKAAPALSPRKATLAARSKSSPKGKLLRGRRSPPKPAEVIDDSNKTTEQRLAEKKELVEKLDIYRMMKEHEERKRRRQVTLMSL